ncbi:CapA family protein [Microbulbifer sp. CAU 1566]|uniref:CapA family protein n=1 Tax=Microbulbifer sp. CAU 1566 TaxID=2933269 RepID=UPI002005FA1D|nr:CapA family protein [Microbulbifer sp. CAU 1566]MCK7597609.1 CapA family protein [Microbulbifer sp. CAU 1566]
MTANFDALAVAQSGALRLAALTGKDGRLRYRYDSESDRDRTGYNVLRHAGTIWAMLDVYCTTRDSALLTSAERATAFLLDEYLRFYKDARGACICEDNKIKLGGNALSALALLEVHRLTGDNFLFAVAERLCHFMLDQRREHGDFVHKRYYKSGKISDFTSEYYVGEALLALISCYELTGNAEILNEVKSVEAELAKQDYGVKEHSHWMLYSLEKLQRHDDSPHIYHHAAKIAHEIIFDPKYIHWGRSTPTACRSEGLLAFLRMDHESNHDGELVRAARERVEANLVEQMNFFLEDGSFVRGGGDRRDREVRIDYIQHNISSFLHYARMAPAEKLGCKVEVDSASGGYSSNKYVLTICGDTNPGDSYQERQALKGKSNILADHGHAYSFTNFRRMLADSNYCVLNLEVSMTQQRESCLSGIKPYLDWTDPDETITVLSDLSVDAVCLSNNHTMDFGEYGLVDTLEYLDRAGIGRFGAGRSPEEALAVQHIYPDDDSQLEHIIFVGGFEYRANHVEWGYYATAENPGVNCWSSQKAFDQISSLRAQYPKAFIVAFPHWGSNYAHVKDKQRRIAEKIVEAGANLILGHGSHALQEVSRCRDVWVCYSLGNFVFNSPGRFSRSDVLPYGLISQLCVPKELGESVQLKLYPIQSNNLKTNYLPDFVEESEFRSVIEYLLAASREQELADISFSKDQYGYFCAIDLT